MKYSPKGKPKRGKLDKGIEAYYAKEHEEDISKRIPLYFPWVVEKVDGQPRGFYDITSLFDDFEEVKVLGANIVYGDRNI